MKKLFAASLLFCIGFISPVIAQPYYYLVFEGGGVRGISYAGALKSLREKNLLDNVHSVAGTSVGALVAGLYAVGYTPEELKEQLDKLKIEKFNDGQWIFIGGLRRLMNNYGWYRGEKIEKWIGKLVKAKTGNANTTLAQLHSLSQNDHRYKDLYVTATNLSKQKSQLLYYKTNPDVPISKAIRASLSIPLYFRAVFIDSSGNIFNRQSESLDRDILIDGGVISNYPITMFDTGRINKHTLGIKLERPEQIELNETELLAPYKIQKFGGYVAALYNLVIESLNRPVSKEIEKERTIYISTGNLNPRVRKMSSAQKELLFTNGQKGVEQFLQRRKATD
jgi:NTE family protein